MRNIVLQSRILKMRLLESEQTAKTNIASAKYYPHHPPKNKARL